MPASAESADAVAVAVDGVRLAELMEQLPVSRGSVFEIIKALKIKTKTGPAPNGRGRVAWLSAADADRLEDAARRVKRKEVKIADLAGGLQRRQTPQTGIRSASGYSADPADPAPFLARLEAAERAMRCGLGLTTAETSWVLGVRPGSSTVTRGGIKATRTAWNCWRLESADSADSAGR